MPKLVQVNWRRFGKGTNPSGGVWAEVEFEDGTTRRIDERLVDNSGWAPYDGGTNPEWEEIVRPLLEQQEKEKGR